MVRKWVVIACATVMLTGCKTEPERWVPTGKVDVAAAQALVACKHASPPEAVPLTEPAYVLPDEHAIAQCMAAHGYTLVIEDSRKPQGTAGEGRLYLRQ